jgi:hypothetical protein
MRVFFNNEEGRDSFLNEHRRAKLGKDTKFKDLTMLKYERKHIVYKLMDLPCRAPSHLITSLGSSNLNLITATAPQGWQTNPIPARVHGSSSRAQLKHYMVLNARDEVQSDPMLPSSNRQL